MTKRLISPCHHGFNSWYKKQEYLTLSTMFGNFFLLKPLVLWPVQLELFVQMKAELSTFPTPSRKGRNRRPL